MHWRVRQSLVAIGPCRKDRSGSNTELPAMRRKAAERDTRGALSGGNPRRRSNAKRRRKNYERWVEDRALIGRKVRDSIPKWGCYSTPTPFPSAAIARAGQQKQINSPSGGPLGALGEARVAGRKALPTPQAESNLTGCVQGFASPGTPFIETMKRCHDKPGSRPLTIQDRRWGALAKSGSGLLESLPSGSALR